MSDDFVPIWSHLIAWEAVVIAAILMIVVLVPTGIVVKALIQQLFS